MNVWKHIQRSRRQGCVHVTVIDPDRQSPEHAGQTARIAAEAGSDLILVGGSTRMRPLLMAQTLKCIKSACPLPAVLFPCGADAVAPGADAVLFMSLLNSRSPRFLIREQSAAAPALRASGVEVISTGYLVLEPGMTVGRVGEADLVPRDDAEQAVRYALAAELFGMALLYLEAGSGAAAPVPAALIAAVRREVSMLLCVGGGIRTPAQAAAIARAGADLVVTGTLVEQESDKKKALSTLIAALKSSS